MPETRGKTVALGAAALMPLSVLSVDTATAGDVASDPSGFIADIINDINIGELIGLS